jgi:hypothetical protein
MYHHLDQSSVLLFVFLKAVACPTPVRPFLFILCEVPTLTSLVAHVTLLEGRQSAPSSPALRTTINIENETYTLVHTAMGVEKIVLRRGNGNDVPKKHDEVSMEYTGSTVLSFAGSLVLLDF